MAATHPSFPLIRLEFKNFFSITCFQLRESFRVYDSAYTIRLTRRTFPNTDYDSFIFHLIAHGRNVEKKKKIGQNVEEEENSGQNVEEEENSGQNVEEKKFYVHASIPKDESGSLSSEMLVRCYPKSDKVLWRVNRKKLLEIYDSVKDGEGNNEMLTVVFRFGPEFEYKIHKNDPCCDWEALSRAYRNFAMVTRNSDTKLQCGNHTVHVHRDFFTARAGNFATQLFQTHDLRMNMEPNDIQRFLEHMYSGTMEDLPPSTVRLLYQMGRQYDLKNLLHFLHVNNKVIDADLKSDMGEQNSHVLANNGE